MALYRAQISFQLDSALPRDAVTINPHYDGDNAQALADALKSNLVANPKVGATTPFTVKIYDAKKAPPSFPLATASSGTGFLGTGFPREIALCLSYYATWNRPGFRGRLYIPMSILGGVAGLRPTTTQRSDALNFGTTLGKSLPSNHFLIVYSRKAGTGAQVTHTWVDDEWDIVRSRGLKGTARTLGTLP